MEHIAITELTSGELKLVPENGWRLYDRRTRRYYIEVVVHDMNSAIKFTARR